MSSIDKLLQDHDWQPNLARGAVRTFTVSLPHNPDKHTAAVHALNNGVLYTKVFRSDGGQVLRNMTYNGDSGPVSNNYSVINLIVSNDDGHQVTTTTFRYAVTKRSGVPTTWLDYTIWHNSRYGEGGLTLLKSVEAVQEIEGGRLDIRINSLGSGLTDRTMKAELTASDMFDEEAYALGDTPKPLRYNGNLSFDNEGKLIPRDSRTLLIALDRLWHPLRGVYNNAFKGIRVDALQTAVGLINAFPKQGPLHIEQLVQYQPQTHQQRSL